MMAKRIPRIDQVLRKALRKMDLDTRLEGYRIWSVWNDIVGEQIARRTQPDRLRNRILFIRVSSSTWMQQLQTMKTMLLERIHQIVREEVIKDIRFFLGEVSPPRQPPLSRQPKKVMKEKRLSGKMEACLHQVKDNELKALVKRIMLKQADTMMVETSEKPDKEALDVNQDSFGSHS